MEKDKPKQVSIDRFASLGKIDTKTVADGVSIPWT